MSLKNYQPTPLSRYLAPLLLVAASAAFPASSMASINFVGGTVSAEYHYPNVGTVLYPSGAAVVGPGVEFNDIGGYGVGIAPSVDVSATNILITYNDGGWWLSLRSIFDGWIVSDALNTIPEIIGATLVDSNITGSEHLAITFDADNVYVNQSALAPVLNGASLAPGSYMSIDVLFAAAPAVPEPASIIAWSALGVAGVVAYRRRHGLGLLAGRANDSDHQL